MGHLICYMQNIHPLQLVGIFDFLDKRITLFEERNFAHYKAYQRYAKDSKKIFDKPKGSGKKA